MKSDREVMQQALDALEMWITPNWAGTGVHEANAAYAAIKAALAQPVPQAMPAPSALPAFPELPDMASMASIQGLQGSEYCLLSTSYESGCAMFSEKHLHEYAVKYALLAIAQPVQPDAYLSANQVLFTHTERTTP